MAADAATLRLRDDPRAISAAAVGVILVATALRAWYSLGGWFYADDFEFLTEMTRDGLTWASMLAPHDSQFMPGGKVAAWLITLAGPFAWPVAAVQLIGLQGIALTMGWLCLRRLFGAGSLSVGLLAVYAFTPLTITSFMWWSSAINQIPLAIAFFGATYAYVGYLRDPRWRGALQTAAWVVFGLLFYVKAALVIVVLALFTALYDVPSGAWRRPAAALRAEVWRLRHAVVLLGTAGVAYTVYYVSQVPSPVGGDAPIDYTGLADTLLRVSFGTAAVGGPWFWSLDNPPLGQVQTPESVVTLAWAAIAVVLTWLAAHRRLDWRPVAILSAYLAITLILTAEGRGGSLGAFAGLELRYLADTAAPLVMCVGLIIKRVDTGQRPESPPTSTSPLLAAACGVVLVGSLFSTSAYSGFWHAYPAATYVENAISASRQGPLNVVDEPPPEIVMPVTSYPSNLPSQMLLPLGDRIRAVDSGTDLSMLNDAGIPYPAYVTPGVTAEEGPLPDCGHQVTDRPLEIPVNGAPQDYFWWMQISYLAGEDGELRVSTGELTRTVEVRSGAHTAYLRGEGAFAPLVLETSSPEVIMCVDRLAIGDISALEPVS